MMKYRNLALAGIKKLAQEIANKTAKTGATIGLIGTLGSGKTTFAKALAKNFGIDSLKSPTFIVSQRYNWGKKFLYHLDFYRLENEKELIPLGLDEILNSNNLAIIEWVDKFPAIQKQCDIIINFEIKSHDKRDVTIKYN